MTTIADYTGKGWLIRPRNGINGKPLHHDHVTSPEAGPPS